MKKIKSNIFYQEFKSIYSQDAYIKEFETISTLLSAILNSKTVGVQNQIKYNVYGQEGTKRRYDLELYFESFKIGLILLNYRNEKKLNQVNSSIEKLLAGNNHLTRDEIMQELDIKRTSKEDFLSAAIMMHAELDGLVCNGKMKGKQITYALLEERVLKPKIKLSKEQQKNYSLIAIA